MYNNLEKIRSLSSKKHSIKMDESIYSSVSEQLPTSLKDKCYSLNVPKRKVSFLI